SRSTVLVNIDFRSLTGKPYQVYLLHDPALTMTGDDDTGTTQDGALVATDGTASDAVAISGGFSETSSGYLGTRDGWPDLSTDHQMDWTYTADQPGNVVHLGRTRLTGTGNDRHATLAIGFGTTTSDALGAARSSLAAGFADAAQSYTQGWHDYLSS